MSDPGTGVLDARSKDQSHEVLFGMTLGSTANPVFASPGGVHFSMCTEGRQMIACVTGRTSLEYFAGRALSDAEMIVVFAVHRRHFERLASALYDMPV